MAAVQQVVLAEAQRQVKLAELAAELAVAEAESAVAGRSVREPLEALSEWKLAVERKRYHPEHPSEPA